MEVPVFIVQAVFKRMLHGLQFTRPELHLQDIYPNTEPEGGPVTCQIINHKFPKEIKIQFLDDFKRGEEVQIHLRCIVIPN